MIELNLPSQTELFSLTLRDKEGNELEGAVVQIRSPISDEMERCKFETMRYVSKRMIEIKAELGDEEKVDSSHLNFDDSKWFVKAEMLAIIASVEGINVTIEDIATHPYLEHFRDQIKEAHEKMGKPLNQVQNA